MTALTTRPLPLTAAALEQEATRLLRKYGRHDQRVLLIRADPEWGGPEEFSLDGAPVRVAGCVSPLAVIEQISRHTERSDGSALVVLTEAEPEELGPGVLSRVIRQQVFMVEPWRLVEENFGVQRLDPRLVAETWAGSALVDAMSKSWPRLTGALLTRDVALRHLAARRLGHSNPDGLDAAAVLLWSTDRDRVDAFRAVRAEERRGLIAWLGETTDGITDHVFRLADGGRAFDALPLGLVCGALWAEGADEPRAQGGILAYLSALSAGSAHTFSPAAGPPTDAAMRDYAAVAERVVRWLLSEDGNEDALRLAHRVLDRADDLIIQFGGQAAARHSDLLRAGFEDRVGDAAAALRSALRGDVTPDPGEAVANLVGHALAPQYAHRVRRAQMAQRLVQWLAEGADAPPDSVGAAIHAQIDDWGWVDRARDDIWEGDLNAAMKMAYGDIYAAVADRRRAADKAFAGRLATWTRSGSGPGDMLTVETLLERVVAPVVTQRSGSPRPVLFLVLDGMSAAVATQLAEELRSRSWEEYDPLPVEGPARRRGVMAALPTLTRVSRTSLLSGRLTSGDQEDERRAFRGHAFWEGRKARLFHRGTLAGGAGEALGDDLARALDDEKVHVGVVLNAIDDSLDKGRDPVWKVDQIPELRTLLDHARYHGRAVIMTSDHGHVLERDSVYRKVNDLASARHRDGTTPAGDGEVELTGPRVVADDNRIVALWDSNLRFGPKKAGYHGGAALAEVTIPLLAFLPLGAAAPQGWRALTAQRPSWWSPVPRKAPLAPAGAAPAVRRPKAKEPMAGQVAFQLPEQAPAASPAQQSMGEELLAIELFQVRHRSTPRRVDLDKIRTAVDALVDAGGVLPLAVLAQRLGEPPVRASGFAAALGQILNIDNYPVLEVVDAGRNVRLRLPLLREQFGLRSPAGR